MISFKNNTPFETTITLNNTFRLCGEPDGVTEISDPPVCKQWFTEWYYILKYSPMFSSYTILIEPWSEFDFNVIKCSETIDVSMGFNDVRTVWKKHVGGIWSWDGNDMECDIACTVGKPSFYKPRSRGPMVAGDIPLRIITKSNNDTWKVRQNPITTIQYTPNLNEEYYKNQG